MENRAPKEVKPIVKTKPVFTTMADFQPGLRLNMNLRVVSVKLVRERKRYDGGSMNRVAECIVGDQHGCVKMMAFDNQLDIVKQGATITVRNANANVVKEHVRLEVDRWAKVEASVVPVSGSVN